MSEWQEMRLGELLSSHGGSIKTGPFGTALKAAEYSTEGSPLISVGEVGSGRIELHKRTPRVGVPVTTRLPEYILRAGDIVFGRKGAVDRSAWLRAHEDGYFLGSDGLRLRLPETVNSRFIALQLQSAGSREWLLQHAAGTTMLSLSQKVLERLPIRLPEFEVQSAIAEILGALDDKIDANERALDAASALVGGLVEQIADSVEVSQLASHSTKSVSVAEFAHEVLLYSLPAFDDGQMPQGVRGNTVKSSKFQISGSCVLFSKLNPRIPRIWDIVDVPEAVALASTEFVVLEPRELSSSLLRAAVSSPRAGRELTNKVAGTSGSHQRIRPADLLALRVPDIRQLSASESAGITALGRSTDDLRRQSAQLARTRDELLPLLMSGRMSVTTAEREVSNVV